MKNVTDMISDAYLKKQNELDVRALEKRIAFLFAKKVLVVYIEHFKKMMDSTILLSTGKAYFLL